MKKNEFLNVKDKTSDLQEKEKRIGSLVILTFFFLFFATQGHPLDGDQENKVQEEALILSIDTEKDSPEMDEFLQKNDLNPEDLDSFEMKKKPCRKGSC